MIRLPGDKVAIIPIRDPDKSSGGIWIPNEAKERSDQGIIKYTGPRCKWLKKGDYVLFSGYSGTTVQFEADGDGTLILMSEKAVKALLDNPDTDVSGLYFKSKLDYAHLLKGLIETISEGDAEGNSQDWERKAKRCIEVFHYHDPYFTATYEMAMNIIASSFENTPFAKGTGFKNPLKARPTQEEIDSEESWNDDEDMEELGFVPDEKPGLL